MSTPHGDRRYLAAIWYAHGRIDADAAWHKAMHSTGGYSFDLDDVHRFARQHAQDAIDSDLGRITFLPSIQDAWKTYVEEHSTPHQVV